MAIVPASFLADGFQDRTKIETIEKDLSFIGQALLPKDTFASSGVDSFATKVMVFHRKADCMESRAYQPDECLTMDTLTERVKEYRILKNSKRLDLKRENKIIDEAETEAFEYTLRKYLYELKTHQKLQKHVDSAVALITKYRNQRPPENATAEQYKQWEKTRLRPATVLAVLKRYIREQNKESRKEVALVKTNYSFKLKQYSPRLLDRTDRKCVPITELLTDDSSSLPVSYDKTCAPSEQYRTALKYINKRRENFKKMNVPLKDHIPSEEHLKYAEEATFINAEGTVCHFTELQKKDLAVILGREQCLLNWQQGSGKTAAVFHRARFLCDRRLVKNTVVIAPAIAIKMTWEPFLQRNGVRFITVRKHDDIEKVTDGTFVVISTTMLSRFKYQISRFVKTRSRKLCLIFDESDELTNPSSQRTRLVLSLFRRLRYKILATGTTTRNNIAELYSQLELLYNNSALMTCWSPERYESAGNEEPTAVSNEMYGQPFPPRGGFRLFRSCHCPTKATVFGIEKMNQDVRNADQLRELIDKTIITRKFKDFAGDRYTIRNETVTPSVEERKVYETVINEFYKICRIYFRDTGNSRKEAGLRLARQIRLLIRACSTPNFMEGYEGESLPVKTEKISRIISSCSGKVAVGCTSLEAVQMYEQYIRNEFPDRGVHVITGDVEFRKRSEMTERFNSSKDDILVCTQQSLSSSVNIPDCDDVIIESLQWNIPRMEQFYFRFIRLDSKNMKRIHFVTYSDSIEQNLLALVTTKERLNDFIRTGQVQSETDIHNEFGIDDEMLKSFLCKETDDKGFTRITWGSQKIA